MPRVPGTERNGGRIEFPGRFKFKHRLLDNERGAIVAMSSTIIPCKYEWPLPRFKIGTAQSSRRLPVFLEGRTKPHNRALSAALSKGSGLFWAAIHLTGNECECIHILSSFPAAPNANLSFPMTDAPPLMKRDTHTTRVNKSIRWI